MFWSQFYCQNARIKWWSIFKGFFVISQFSLDADFTLKLWISFSRSLKNGETATENPKSLIWVTTLSSKSSDFRNFLWNSAYDLRVCWGIFLEWRFEGLLKIFWVEITIKTTRIFFFSEFRRADYCEFLGICKHPSVIHIG